MAGEGSGTFIDGQANNGESWTQDVFLSKFNSDGSKEWTKLIGTHTTEGIVSGNSISTSIDGSIYISGYTFGDLDGHTNRGTYDGFVCKFNSDGSKIWTQMIASPSSDQAASITAAVDGSVYATGITRGDLNGEVNNGQTDIFISKFKDKNIINSLPNKGKLRGTRQADQFTFDQFESFGGKTADRIIRFKPSQGDTIGVSAEAFPSLQGVDEITFASASTKQEFKALSRQDVDFVYFETKGRLFFNGNGSDKGWGDPDEGGLFAILKGKPELSVEDFTLLA